MLWQTICSNPLFYMSEFPFDAADVMFFTGSVPRVLFSKVTSFITAFIAFERCLCIALPLKVRMIITPLKTKFIIVSIYALMILIPTPYYVGFRLGWVLDSSRNSTILKISYSEEQKHLEAIVYLIYGVLLSILSFVFIICCIVVLVVKLNVKTKWRQLASSRGVRKTEGVAGAKERTVGKMVTSISTIFVICSMPSIFLICYMAIEHVCLLQAELKIPSSISKNVPEPGRKVTNYYSREKISHFIWLPGWR
ncbi:uncharacterized protein LOC106013824 [Aplysia californica]|uniref:Uncharacterized protein LOC106013824 n=1 Tax=Aplysia californica TaxID=6500 RepID=A0ABM1AE76_APLCA|nr:uncharacterized protein LOC106013824 [Aplysia californica]